MEKTSIYGIAPWHRKNVTITLRKSRIPWNLNSRLASRNLLTGSIYVNYCFDPYKWTGKQGNIPFSSMPDVDIDKFVYKRSVMLFLPSKCMTNHTEADKSLWRVLPPPSDGRVSGFMGASFRCARVDLFGHIDPFESVDAFHEQFFCTLPSISDATMQSLATRTRAKKYRLCFSHCDIRPQNILVDDNQRPVGLIDWDSAAWMPEYWEFTAAVHKRLIYEPWVDTFKRTFLQYKDELTLEIELWKTVSPY